jgi:hypothetical protein
LQQLRRPEEVAELRGLSVNAVLGLSGGGDGQAEASEEREPVGAGVEADA